MTQHAAQRAMAALLLLGAAFLVREALRLPIAWTSAGPGSGFFPFWLAVGVVIVALTVLRSSLRPPRAAERAPFVPASGWKPLLIVFLPMVAVVAVIGVLGIYLGGALYLAGYMRLVGRSRWAATVLVSVLIPLGLYLLFETWFLLPMPKGTLLEAILYRR
jgi:hypothetical protein